MKAWTSILVVSLLSGAVGGCGDSRIAPSPSPTPTPAPQPVVLAVFADPVAPNGTTSDIRDVHEEIVRLDLTSGSLIWVADGRMFAGYPVSNGYFLRADRAFQVRFGTKDGQRRAYFTETGSATICDISVVGGTLVILPTNEPVPGGG
jgi:hypothetical protein